jgi:hypothetical protein
MLDHLSHSDEVNLAHVADQALRTCLTTAGQGRLKLDEVPAVEAVVRVGMRMIARQWRLTGNFSKGGLALQTVFTHAAPKVNFSRPSGGTGRCELADVLFVIDDPSAILPESQRRAVLVQAKLHDPPRHLHLNSGNERVQFELLSAWPAFTFHASFYRPHVRHLTHGPAEPEWSGEYGGIDQPPPGEWTQYHILNSAFATTPPISGAITLGTLLTGMLAGRGGHGRPAIPHGRDPWSETVDELLDVTFKRPLRRRQPRSRRGREYHLAFMNFDDVVDGRAMPQQLLADGDAKPPDLVGEGDEWPDGAISVVRFTVGERPSG